MHFYVFKNEDKLATAYDRCFLDVENGRTWLALQRLEDMREHFPDDPDIDHAEAILRSNFLGQGFRVQELCWKAFQQKPSLQDTSQALEIALKFSPDAASFQKRATIALRSFPNNLTINMLIQDEKVIREGGEPYWVFQRILLRSHLPKQDTSISASMFKIPGLGASMIELILNSGGEEIPPDEQAQFLRLRGELLRELDKTAENKLSFLGEYFIPKDRLALQQALLEFERKIDDPYFRNAETLNLCAAWSFLLHNFKGAIEYADAAEELGGPEYINPVHNKAVAHSALGNQVESKFHFQKALEMAKRQGDKVQAQFILQSMEKHLKEPPSKLAELRPKLESVINGAGDAAYHELTAGKGTLESMGGNFLNRLQKFCFEKVGFDWSPAYLLLLEELLVFYSPDAAVFIINKATENLPEQTDGKVNANLRIAAHYLSAYASGVLRRDAVRLRTLQLISLLDAGPIINAYVKQVRDISLEADPPLSEVALLIKDEMARVHPRLPHFLDDQPPMSADDRQRAKSVIREVFSVRFEPANNNHIKPMHANQVNMTDSAKPPNSGRKSWLRKLFRR